MAGAGAPVGSTIFVPPPTEHEGLRHNRLKLSRIAVRHEARNPCRLT